MNRLAARMSPLFCIGVGLMTWVAPTLAQGSKPARLLEPLWGAPAHCGAMLEQLNQRAADARDEDFLAAGLMLETSECVARDDKRASQYYAQAARRGNAPAARRLALLFGAGRGVPQSYANAGAWLAGKGDTDESIEPWDYSVGRAYTLVATTLERLRYPQDAWPAGSALTLVVEADTQNRGQVHWRFTGDRATWAEALRGPLAAAFDAASAQAVARLAPVDPRYLVPARVTLPIAVRRERDDRFVVTEQEPLLR